MKSIDVKYNINRLIQKLGSKKAVSKELDCTVRYVEMMLKGKKVSSALATLIKTKLI